MLQATYILKTLLRRDALKAAQEAVDQYIHMPLDERPEGFTTRPRELEPGKGGRYEHGFAFDRSLEAMTVHSAIWTHRQRVHL